MEMLRSLRGDKHEFCLTVIKFELLHSIQSCISDAFVLSRMLAQIAFTIHQIHCT